MGEQALHEACPLVRPCPCEQEIEGAAEAVDIGPGVGKAGVKGLFRRHEIDRSHQGARHGDRVTIRRLLAGQSGEAQVENLHDPSGIDHQVRGFDITVDDSSVVSDREPPRGLDHRVECLRRREDAPRPHEIAQVSPFHELHDQKMGPASVVGVDRADDVGVIELRRRLGLAVGPLDQLCVSGE